MVDAFIFPAERFLLIGKIVKPHGVKGDLKIFLYSEQPENLQSYRQITLVDQDGGLSPSFKIRKCRPQGKMAIVSIASFTSRNQAEQLLGFGVLIEKTHLPKTNKDEYYWYQMEGLPVSTIDGRELGTISYIFSNGAQDIMVCNKGDQEFMIPIHDSIITEHNDEGVTINPPPGLLELHSGDQT